MVSDDESSILSNPFKQPRLPSEPLLLESAKARMRSQRWDEEAMLLLEEYRHQLIFVKHQARPRHNNDSARWPPSAKPQPLLDQRYLTSVGGHDLNPSLQKGERYPNLRHVGFQSAEPGLRNIVWPIPIMHLLAAIEYPCMYSYDTACYSFGRPARRRVELEERESFASTLKSSQHSTAPVRFHQRCPACPQDIDDFLPDSWPEEGETGEDFGPGVPVKAKL
ncbi:hypothetical protein C8R47DRAFT_1216091 [Mycena vitilis]|nr:hypothetical protein C8R47DRAFT_1216091 [Mycena vitilis]